MKKYILLILIVAAAAAVIAAAAWPSQKNSGSKPQIQKIRVAYKKSVPSFPIFVGIKQGYFQKQNLEVEPIAFESTNQMIEAVARGDVEASAVGAVEPALAATAVSEEIFKIYGQVRWSKDNFLDYVLVRRDSPIASIQNLRGKKIGVAPGGASVIYTKLFLKNFFDPEEAAIEQLDPKVLIQALEAGSVDAIIGNEPLGTIAIQKGVAKILLERPYTDFVPFLPEITGIGLISEKFVNERPETARNFVAAMNDAFAYGNANPEAVRAILPECCGVGEEIAPHILHLGIYSGSKELNRTALQKFADFLYDQNLLEKRINTANLIY